MLPENQMQGCIAKGRLVRVLANRRPPFPGHHLYYPSRRLAVQTSLCSSKRCATAVQIGNDRMWREADIRKLPMSGKCQQRTTSIATVPSLAATGLGSDSPPIRVRTDPASTYGRIRYPLSGIAALTVASQCGLTAAIRSAGLGGASGLNVARRHGLVAHFPEQLFRCLNELVALRRLRHPRSDLA